MFYTLCAYVPYNVRMILNVEKELDVDYDY